METIQQAKDAVMASAERGCDCPVCGQKVKIYRRGITSAMAYGLYLLQLWHRNNPKSEWCHLEQYFKSLPGVSPSIRGDMPKLRHWGLISSKNEKRPDESNRNGLYKITPKGVDFVLGRISVPSNVIILNNKILGFGQIETDFKKALKNKFDFAKLMEGFQ
jgi:hypothetical protein